MKAEILVIGDEILIGQVTDTNSGWLCKELNTLGFEVSRITVVQDRANSLKAALEEVLDRVPLVIVTGGLGPTRDDLTKQTFCDFLETQLFFNEDAYGHIERMLQRFGKGVNALNKKQAELPGGSEYLQNDYGTAPGMWMKRNSTVYVALPGVPFEMKNLFRSEVEPRLKERFITPYHIHRTILTEGIPESDLAGLIEDWELTLPSHIRLAYLPKLGAVRLRLSGLGDNREMLEKDLDSQIQIVLPLIQDYFKGFETHPQEVVLGNLLTEKKLSLGLAESCTGGYLSHLLTSVPGSSNYFMGSVICYSNKVKLQKLGVNENLLLQYGAVSEEVALEMANKSREYFKSDLGVGITGIAGPGGATESKPVGMVCIAVSTSKHHLIKTFYFKSDRKGNIERAASSALNMLIKTSLEV